MQVVGMSVDWNCGVMNPPDLNVVFAGPAPETMWDLNKVWETYAMPAGTFYLLRDELLVHFLYHTPKDQNGYGGFVFKILTKNGVQFVKGPWSSNSDTATKVSGLPLMHIHYSFDDDPRSLYSATMIVHDVQDALNKFLPDIKIGLVVKSYGSYWEILNAKPDPTPQAAGPSKIVSGFPHPKTGVY